MHPCALGLTSLHPAVSASLSDGSAVLQQLHADYPSYSPGGTTVHLHVTYVICDFINVIYQYLHAGAQWCHLANTMDT